MAVQYKDYYQTLGVKKDASKDDLKKAFRDLARKYHPDKAKAEQKEAAEAKFKEINEAYEVLKDPEKRARYEQLGANWDQPGGFGGGRYPRQGGADQGGYEFHFGGTGFSDFFEQFFGGSAGDPFSRRSVNYRGAGGRPGANYASAGRDVEAELMVTLEEILRGDKRRVTLRKVNSQTGEQEQQSFNVKIPAGVSDGQRIRLTGQGDPGFDGGRSGDLYLRVRFAQHPYFRVKGTALYYELELAPWQAVLGDKVTIPSLQTSVRLQIKPGAQSGQKLRIPKYGLVDKAGEKGDLYAVISIKIPKDISEEERKHWEALKSLGNS